MVVGIAHGPAAQMPLRIPVIRAVDMLHIGIRPLLEQVDLFHILIETKKDAVLVSARKKKQLSTTVKSTDMEHQGLSKRAGS